METKELAEISRRDTLNTLNDVILNECEDIILKNDMNREAVCKIISKAIKSTQEYSRTIWRLFELVKEQYPCIFNVITRRVFLDTVKKLRKATYQKIENRNIGISLIFFKRGSQVDLYGNYSLQLSQNIEDIDNFFMQASYKGIDAQKAYFAFVYDEEKKKFLYKGIKSFGVESFESICVDDAVGFSAAESAPCVRIYHAGKRIVDYIMSETTGDWLIRFEDYIKNMVSEHIGDVNEEDKKIITKITMQLSYLRIGSMLIITSNLDTIQECKSCYDLNSLSLENDLKSETIYKYAANDGAVIIYKEKGKRLKAYRLGAILNPQGGQFNNSKYFQLTNNNNCGSRHEKAARYACEHPDDCVIVVSENRSISILHGTDPIYWRDDPDPLKERKKRKENRNP